MRNDNPLTEVEYVRRFIRFVGRYHRDFDIDLAGTAVKTAEGQAIWREWVEDSILRDGLDKKQFLERSRTKKMVSRRKAEWRAGVAKIMAAVRRRERWRAEDLMRGTPWE